MKRFLPCLLCQLGLFLVLAGPALAHRVHLFASVDQGAVVADGRFGKNRPARNAAVEVYAGTSDKPLVQGRTDEQGAARLPLPPDILAHPQELRVRLDAGTGHRAEWIIPADALSGQGEERKAATPVEAPSATPTPPVPSGPSAQSKDAAAPPASCPDAADAAALEERLTARIAAAAEAAVTRALAAHWAKEQAERLAEGPGLVEIVGGLGWIAGIFGLLAWWQARK